MSIDDEYDDVNIEDDRNKTSNDLLYTNNNKRKTVSWPEDENELTMERIFTPDDSELEMLASLPIPQPQLGTVINPLQITSSVGLRKSFTDSEFRAAAQSPLSPSAKGTWHFDVEKGMYVVLP